MLALRHNTDTSFSLCCLIIIIAIHLFGSQYSLRCWDDVLYRFSPVVCVHVMTSDVVFMFWAENISWISKPWKCSFIHKYILLKLCSIGVTCDNGAFLDIILVGAKIIFAQVEITIVLIRLFKEIRYIWNIILQSDFLITIRV